MPSLIEAKDVDGCTILAFAIFYNNFIAVNHLLEKGANIQAPCNLRIESLRIHFAGSDKEEKFEKYLRYTFRHKTPEMIPGTQVELAVLLNRATILEQLHKHTPISIEMINRNMILAKIMGNEEVFQFLMNTHRDSLSKLASQIDLPSKLTSNPTLFCNTKPALSSKRENQIKGITSNLSLKRNGNAN